MKKIFVLILVCLSFRFLFVGNNEDITNKSNSHNLITNTSNSSKERIIYNSGKIKDNKLIIKEYSSNEFTINVNEYEFYKINNYSVNELYIANCGYQEGQLDGLIYIKLIPANSMYVFKTEGISRENHCLEILHFTDDIPHISYVEIEDDLFDIIVLQSQIVENIYVKTKRNINLLNCLNFEKNYILSKTNNKANNEKLSTLIGEYANEKKTITTGKYDEITSTNGTIYKYANDEEYRLSNFTNSNNMCGSDNPIVNIIPKELFKSIGVYSYIGKEYGFYINTNSNDSNSYISEFIYFDIKTLKRAYGQKGIVEIIPLFSGYAEYWHAYDRVFESLGGSNLALANISVTLGIQNTDELNIGDEGYIPTEDYGYAFSTYDVTAFGSPKNSGTEIDTKYLKIGATMLGNIPKVGTALKFASLAGIQFYDKYYNVGYRSQLKNLTRSDDGGYCAGINYTNALTNTKTMITQAGNLIKGIQAKLVTSDGSVDKDNPLLYKPKKDDSFYVQYNTFQKNSDINWDSVISTIISLDIVEDNTYNNNVSKGGTLDYMDSVIGGYCEKYNEYPPVDTNVIYESQPTAVEYGYDGYQYLLFDPSISGTYTIETYGTLANTGMILFEGNSFLTANSSSGTYINENGEKISAKITYYLDASKTYKIQISGDLDSAGYTNVIVKLLGDQLEETKRDYSDFCENYYTRYSVWQEFSPTENGVYTIFTSSSSNYDTVLKLYDTNHEMLAKDDDSGYLNNAKIQIYLEKNQVYYIQSKLYYQTSTSKSFSVIIIQEEDVVNQSCFDFSETYTISNSDDVIYIKFNSNSSYQYTFTTSFISGKKDLYMYILDANFNVLYYNDDSAGNLQPRITNYFNGEYYILIRQYSSYSTEATTFNFIMAIS